MMSTFRSRIVHLAQKQPQLRAHLVPLLRTSSDYDYKRLRKLYVSLTPKQWMDWSAVPKEKLGEIDLLTGGSGWSTRFDFVQALRLSDFTKMRPPPAKVFKSNIRRLSLVLYRGVSSEEAIETLEKKMVSQRIPEMRKDHQWGDAVKYLTPDPTYAREFGGIVIAYHFSGGVLGPVLGVEQGLVPGWVSKLGRRRQLEAELGKFCDGVFGPEGFFFDYRGSVTTYAIWNMSTLTPDLELTRQHNDENLLHSWGLLEDS